MKPNRVSTAQGGGILSSHFRRRVVAGREAGIADSFEPSIFAPGPWQARGLRRGIEGGTLAYTQVVISVNHMLNELRKGSSLPSCPVVIAGVRCGARQRSSWSGESSSSALLVISGRQIRAVGSSPWARPGRLFHSA
jgi:hypothetical protein